MASDSNLFYEIIDRNHCSKSIISCKKYYLSYHQSKKRNIERKLAKYNHFFVINGVEVGKW